MPWFGDIGRADDPADHPKNESGDEDRAEDPDARDRVGAAVENLRHKFRGGLLPCGHRELGNRAAAVAIISKNKQCATSLVHVLARDTPPETISAITLALSAAIGVTREVETTSKTPAMLYEKGR